MAKELVGNVDANDGHRRAAVVLVVIDELALEQAHIAHGFVGWRDTQDIGGLCLATEDGFTPTLENGCNCLHVRRGERIHDGGSIAKRHFPGIAASEVIVRCR